MILTIKRNDPNNPSMFQKIGTGRIITDVEAVHSREDRDLVVNASATSEDGRSQWFWLRLDNGDLMFACYPQGDTVQNTRFNRSV